MQMRGGTSKGLYFLASDLPADPQQRDALLLAVMGSGHPMQVDGVGGGHPLAAKVAVVSPSQREDADLDYLFLQLGVDEPTITDRQNCGNLLAGVGLFAAERGLIGTGARVDHGPHPHGELGLRGHRHVRHTGGRRAVRRGHRHRGRAGQRLAGPAAVRRRPGLGHSAACCPPATSPRDIIDGIEVTCVDNGMPVVVARASDLGLTGAEPAADLAGNGEVWSRVQALAAGRRAS